MFNLQNNFNGTNLNFREAVETNPTNLKNLIAFYYNEIVFLVHPFGEIFFLALKKTKEDNILKYYLKKYLELFILKR